MCYVSMLCWFSSELFCSLMNSGLCCLVCLSVCVWRGKDWLLSPSWPTRKHGQQSSVSRSILLGINWSWLSGKSRLKSGCYSSSVVQEKQFKWALNSSTAETIFYLDEDKGLCFLPRMNANGWMQNAGTQVNSELYLTPFPGVLYPAPQREYFQTSLWPLISTPPPTSANTPRKEWYLSFYSQ